MDGLIEGRTEHLPGLVDSGGGEALGVHVGDPCTNRGRVDPPELMGTEGGENPGVEETPIRLGSSV